MCLFVAAAISTDSSVLNKFKAGFNECATEVSRYVSRIEGVDPALRQRLLSHLSNCLASMNSSGASPPFQQGNLSFGNTFPGMLQSLSVQIPAGGGVAIVPAGSRSSSSSGGHDINNNNGSSSSPPGKLFAGLSVIPSRLPNGDFAFLLPSQAMSFHLPSSSSLPSSSGPDRNSQSSWPPTSPSSKRSPSPADDAMSEDVLSPTCSDAGSDVFLEQPAHHHHHKERPPFRRHSQMSEPESVWRPW